MTPSPASIGVMTSGGDAPGMNAAVRAVARMALDLGIKVYAIFDGYQGMVDGGDGIRELNWDAVSGILHRGGTAIGTARCQAFRTHEGRLRAAQHLLERGISKLVVIGGDGSLTGAHQLQTDWPGLLGELVERSLTTRQVAERHAHLVKGFETGKRLGLVIRNENANPIYTTSFIGALFEEEGGDLFAVRQAILGHLQQGGSPSPFDRIQATRLASRCITYLVEKATEGTPDAAFIGLQGGRVCFHAMEEFPRMVERDLQRPTEQWWLNLRPIARILAQPGPSQQPQPEAIAAEGV